MVERGMFTAFLFIYDISRSSLPHRIVGEHSQKGIYVVLRFNGHVTACYFLFYVECCPATFAIRQRISHSRKTGVIPLIQDKLFFILIYLKTNPLQELHTIQFGMTQPQVNKWLHLLSGILRCTLKTMGELPDRSSKRLIYILKSCTNSSALPEINMIWD